MDHEWTNADIEYLFRLLCDSSTSINEAARCLGRTRNSVIHAARKMLIQQLVHEKSKTDVVQTYGAKKIRAIMGNSKFYVPLYEDPTAVPTQALMIVALLFAAGIARWGMVLCASPLLHQ